MRTTTKKEDQTIKGFTLLNVLGIIVLIVTL